MAVPIQIRQASETEIDEAISIDTDACVLYAAAGLPFDFPPEHPFARAEYAQWKAALRQGGGFFAVGPDGATLGLLVMDHIGGQAHLEQLSVRSTAMRQGIGRRLLAHAIAWAGVRPLWLTTYAHVPWNRPFYESEGFSVVPETECPKAIREVLEDQRKVLPAPEQRIAMRRLPASR